MGFLIILERFITARKKTEKLRCNKTARRKGGAGITEKDEAPRSEIFVVERAGVSCKERNIEKRKNGGG